MKGLNNAQRPIGFWFEARLLCVDCFRNQGHVCAEDVVTEDDLIGLLSKCAICLLPLWCSI